MKTTIRSLTMCVLMSAACLTSTQAQQQFLNGSLENWTQKTAGSKNYQEPQGWFTFNYMVRFVGFAESTLKHSNAHSGSYAALLETQTNTLFGDEYAALLSSGLVIDTTFPGGPELERNLVPFSDRPDALEFYMMAAPENGDTNLVACYLTKWNTTTNQRDTVGVAVWENTAVDTSAYARVEAPFVYVSSEMPDSMSFIATSSISLYGSAQAGSKLYLDDLQLLYASTGIEESLSETQKSLYPNPASNEVFITTESQIRSVELYDLRGRRVMSENTLNNNTLRLDIRTLPEGNYMLRILHQAGNHKTERLMIAR